MEGDGENAINYNSDDEGAHNEGAHHNVPVGEGENEVTEAPVSHYNLRANRERNYSHRFDSGQQFMSFDSTGKSTTPGRTEMHHQVVGHVMTQMTANAGIKKHGDRAVEALLEEFCQLDDKGVFEPKDAKILTGQQKRDALRAINLIKEKRCGKLKGRTCADGRSQRGLYTKEQTASPTVSTDSLMLSLMIDALEQRDVATADVAGAYLHAEMDEFVLIKLTGDAVNIMCKANKKYEAYVTLEGGHRVLYLQLMKALYGCVRSALLWYELFSTTLQGMGFELNPYDLCVANKNVRGKQCTIAWYVDDTKISHADSTVVTEVIEKIEERFGKMTVTRGKEHVFLGMKIKLNDDKTVRIDMSEYVKEAIAESQEDVSKGSTTPASKNLFEINLESPKLNIEKAERFHSVVAKLLYTSKRGRPDIQLAIAFLCTRVSCSAEEDWSKLKRLLQYLNRTVNDYVVLGADCLTVLKTWVDAAYGVHHDMKSHTGGVMSLGRGVIMCKSSKQKLNTKSSTEAEVVGASDYLPNTIWAKSFLEAQGYEIKENIFNQDNQSAMKLETNGRKSCGQKSRHIDIRYFFMKDRVETENIRIVYCPTEQMLADFFTKPLQGALFLKFKRVLMGHAHVDTLALPLTSSPTAEERVGEKRENEGTKISEEDTTVAKKTIGSLEGDITSTVSDENWITVRPRTRQVRTQGDLRGPSKVEAKKPMGNNAAEKNERSSHSIV